MWKGTVRYSYSYLPVLAEATPEISARFSQFLLFGRSIMSLQLADRKLMVYHGS
jgi:hypothetical protein